MQARRASGLDVIMTTATQFRSWCESKGYVVDGYGDGELTLALGLTRPVALLEAAGTCKPGERADLTGCTPATGDAAKRKASRDASKAKAAAKKSAAKPKESPAVAAAKKAAEEARIRAANSKAEYEVWTKRVRLAPDEPLKPLSAAAAVNMDHFADSLAGSSLDDAKKQEYRAGLERVFSRIPDAAQKRITENVGKVRFHENSGQVARASVQDLHDSETEKASQRSWLVRGFEWLAGLDKLRDALFDLSKVEAEVKQRAAGSYHRGTKTMDLDGPPSHFVGLGKSEFMTGTHVHAHELGHAIDGPNHELSLSDAWKAAYAAEIDLPDSPLTDYAKTEPEEGFAEFSRLLYGGGFRDDEILGAFPRCAQFFKDRGLWRN